MFQTQTETAQFLLIMLFYCILYVHWAHVIAGLSLLLCHVDTF